MNGVPVMGFDISVVCWKLPLFPSPAAHICLDLGNRLVHRKNEMLVPAASQLQKRGTAEAWGGE